MNIWLQSNIETHDFINKEYWLENYNSVEKAILDAKVCVFVDDNSGKIIAFIGLVGNYIAGFFVLENSRSNAIGKAMLDYVKI